MTPTPNRARLNELLAAEATQRLTPAEVTELDALLDAFPDEDPDAMELAAAALHLGMSFPLEEIPAALAEQLHLNAVVLTPTARTVPARSAPRPAPKSRDARKPEKRLAWAAWGGWVVAAGLAGVAILLLANPREKRVEVVKEVPVIEKVDVPGKTIFVEVEKKEPTLAERKRDLEKDPAAKTFTETKDGVSVSVVWSQDKKDGVMEVRGLAEIDPTKEQYQLWIVDKNRKEATPISAGVFDVRPTGATLVRVGASLPIGDTAAFAISREPIGGRVQPTKENILMVIPPKVG